MNMASNSFFNTPSMALPLWPIANLAPTGITTNSATLNASLSAPVTNYAVTVYWGATNGGTNTGAWTNSASVGSWTNVALTNIAYQVSGLSSGTKYFYAFRATNATTNAWATPSWQFMTLGGTQVVPPVASFTASATNGVEPLAVTFTDTSTGSPTSWYWNFGDAVTSAIRNPSHTYTGGTWTVSLIASNGGGASSSALISIKVITPQQSWQNLYGVAADSSDPLGKGISNYKLFLAGFNPTNPSAYPHITSIVKTGNDIVITCVGSDGDTNYAGGPSCRTNLLEFTDDLGHGIYTNNFISTGVSQILSNGNGTGKQMTMTDPGGMTNTPARYFRVRILVP